MKFILKTTLMVVLCIFTSAHANNLESLKYILIKSNELQTRFTNFYPELEKLNQKNYVLVEKDISFMNASAIERSRFENAVFGYLEDHQYTVKKRFRKSRVPDDYKLKDTMAYLTVALTMYDNFLATQLRLYGLKKIRRFLNTGDSAIGKRKNLFKKSVKRFASYKFRKRMRRAIKNYEYHFLKSIDKYKDDPQMMKMHQIIAQSYTYQRLANQNFWEGTGDYINILWRKMKIGYLDKVDFINRASKKTVYLISKGFGNTVGLVQFRNGHLYNDGEFLNQVISYAKPLDIILEKTPFRLTDRFIPGFWGHAAIYIGNEVQLKELGMWDHPEIVPYHDRIRLGQTIIEALRSGVEINSFKHFSNIDDFVLMRQKEAWEPEEARASILRAFRQIGKVYDFAFNVETPESIVCSELHYTVFRYLEFQTTKVLGRHTINVDQVSFQGYSGQAFEPHILYLGGVEITENIQEEFDRLVEMEQGEYDDNEDRAHLIRESKNVSVK